MTALREAPGRGGLDLARLLGTWLETVRVPDDVRSIHVTGAFARGEWSNDDETAVLVTLADDSPILRAGPVCATLSPSGIGLPPHVPVRYATTRARRAWSRLHPAAWGWSAADHPMLLWGEPTTDASPLRVPPVELEREVRAHSLRLLFSIAALVSGGRAPNERRHGRSALARHAVSLVRCLLWRRLGTFVTTHADVVIAGRHLLGGPATRLLDDSGDPSVRWAAAMDGYLAAWPGGAARSVGTSRRVHDWRPAGALGVRDAALLVAAAALPRRPAGDGTVFLHPAVLDDVASALTPPREDGGAIMAAARRHAARHVFCWLGDCESALAFARPEPVDLALSLLAATDAARVLAGGGRAERPEAALASLAALPEWLTPCLTDDLLDVLRRPHSGEGWLQACRAAGARLAALLEPLTA
jgi:hypothetical protein